jgi:hypothetical protein
MLVNYSLLGVVYARFSRPAKRAGTLKFSKHMVLYEVRQAGPMQEMLVQGVLLGLVVVAEARSESVCCAQQSPRTSGT